MRSIYLDHAASTPLLPEAWEAMRPWALSAGNAASSHAFGRAARKAVDDARARIARCLDADPDEILFTSGATEANNLAVFGLVGDSVGAIAFSPLEHPCVLEPLQKLVGRGFTPTPLPVQQDGMVGPLPTSWPDDLRLATLMLVNHEIGAIQPVRELRQALPAKMPLHCDAAAAVGKILVSFRQLGVSTLTLAGHKFHGPQGIGVLVVKRGTRLNPLHFGGHQQHGKRPGTEPVALAVGLATALEWSCQNLDRHAQHVRQLRKTFLESLRGDPESPVGQVLNLPESPTGQIRQVKNLPHGDSGQPLQENAGSLVVNSPPNSVPHVVNISFPGLKADSLLMALDLAGVACSTGSACSSGSLLPSPVLRAMAARDDVLHAAMRFSFSPLQSLAEVSDAARRIAMTVNRLWTISSAGDD